LAAALDSGEGSIEGHLIPVTGIDILVAEIARVLRGLLTGGVGSVRCSHRQALEWPRGEKGGSAMARPTGVRFSTQVAFALERLVLAAGITGMLVGANVLPVDAQVQGPCYVTGYETSRFEGFPDAQAHLAAGAKTARVTDLGLASSWPVRPDTTLVVAAESSLPQTRLTADFVLFGLRFPVLKLHGSLSQGLSGPWDMRSISTLTRTLAVRAQSDTCDGWLLLTVDRNPLATAAGAGGVAVALVGAIGTVGVALRRRKARRVMRNGVERSAYPMGRRVGALVAGGVFGLLLGSGAAVYMEEVGTFSPLDPRVLMVAAAGLIVGLALGLFGGRRSRPAAKEGELGAKLPARGLAFLLQAALAVAAVTGIMLAAGAAHLAYPVPIRDAISPDQARQLFYTAWTAIQQKNPSVLDACYADQAFFIGRDTIRDPPPTELAVARLQVLVPHQGPYPAEFVAYGHIDTSEGSQKSGAYVFALFTRPTAVDHWKLKEIVYEDDKTVLPKAAADPEGYLETSSNSNLLVPPVELPGLFAKYLSDGLASGVPGSEFAPGVHSSQVIQAILANNKQGAALGFAERDTISAEPSFAAHSYALRDGSALVFFLIRQDFQISLPTCFTHGGSGPAYSESKEHYVVGVIAIDPGKQGTAGAPSASITARSPATGATSTSTPSILAATVALGSIDSTPCPRQVGRLGVVTDIGTLH
jgi:hypothetical protein